MHVSEVWRHPVKSLQGESLASSAVEANGLAGDRMWGIRDVETGKVLTGRREPRLLLASATFTGDGPTTAPTITLPDGHTLAGDGADTDAALSAWLGRPVTLADARATPPADAEAFVDSTDDSSQVVSWTMPADRFVDALPILVLTTASLRAGAKRHGGGQWEVRRFRPNVLIDVDGDDWEEDGWAGQQLRIDDVVLNIVMGCPRCTMVTRPQPGLQRDVDIFKTLAREHDSTYGVWANVVATGEVRVGARAELVAG